MKNTFVWVNQLKSKQRGGGVVANMANQERHVPPHSG